MFYGVYLSPFMSWRVWLVFNSAWIVTQKEKWKRDKKCLLVESIKAMKVLKQRGILFVIVIRTTFNDRFLTCWPNKCNLLQTHTRITILLILCVKEIQQRHTHISSSVSMPERYKPCSIINRSKYEAINYGFDRSERSLPADPVRSHKTNQNLPTPRIDL